ncbi:MAG: ATP-binding protein [Oscillospiraceae bacterium]|nr:ATP-binding protein [Oscillospiraceae bacterium]MCL2278044.1 ATP-binding protein [Oscillospiraceae bacterium]
MSVGRDEINFEMCVDEKECILCGTCLKTCFRRVRSYRDDCADFISDLREGKEYSALIAPSLFLNFPDEYEYILGYLKSLGVKKFYPVSFGADIAVWGYVNYIHSNRAKGRIAQSCPVIVTHIEKHMPQLIDNLIPIQSPMMCTAIYLKKYLKIPEELVFISPCIAKKLEMESKRGMGLVKYNVTFKHLMNHIKSSNIKLSNYKKTGDEIEYGMGSILPMPGGLKYNLDYHFAREAFIMQVEGEREAYEYLDVFSHSVRNDSDAIPELLDILNCKSGCVGGTGLESGNIKMTQVAYQAHLMREKKAARTKVEGNLAWVHPGERIARLNESFKDLDINDFMCEYEVAPKRHKKIVTEEDIEIIFNTHLLKLSDDARHTNCSACGYGNCRAMAEAVALGINHKENCVYFTRNALLSAVESQIITENSLRTIIDIMPMVAIVIDHKLNIIDSNGEALRLFGVSTTEELDSNFLKLSPKLQPDGSVSKERIKGLYDEAYSGGLVHYEWTYLNTEGEKIPCDMTAIRFDILGENHIICFIQDKRDYYKNLENITLMEQRLKAMLDASPILCAIYDENLKITDANEAAATLFGITDKRVYMERLYDLCPELQPCGTPSIRKAHRAIAQTFKEGRTELEWMHCTLDKQTMIPCYVNLERVRLLDKTVVVAFVRDMRKEKDMIEKLKTAISREQDANSAKTRFLTNMSHELRTPMNAIMGISELEIRGGTHSDETEEAFLRIYNASSLLLSIVNDILDLSKVESGKMDITPSLYKTSELIVDTVQLNLMNFGSKEIAFSLTIDRSLPEYLIGDELRIKQILNNLLSNAIKYTDKGEINLDLSIAETNIEHMHMLCMKVRDTGQGLTQRQMDNLFVDEFVRFNLKTNREIQGSGLGLSITHRLVEMMGGDISVESEKGVGSTFTVNLPQKSAGSGVLGEEEAARLEDLQTIQTAFMNITKVEHEPMPYGKVLVVDDVESNLYVAKGIMMPYKLNIDTALNGREVITKIKKGETYDVIFMDHMMPEMDGVEATKILRSLGYKGPIIALTANTLFGAKEMFLENGFTDFASKPVDINQIEEFLFKFVRDKHKGDG